MPARSTHTNDSRTSRLQAEARFAGSREVVETTTAGHIVEERDWELNGHKESQPVKLLGGKVVLSEKAWSRLQAMKPRTDPKPETRTETMSAQEISLRDALTMEYGRRLTEDQVADRTLSWHAMNRYVFQDGIANPWQAFQNLLAVVRRVSPEYLGSLSQTDLAILMTNDPRKRAQFSAREIRVVEEQMRKWGVTGFHALGGTKSETAREAYARAQKGNTNRRDGTERKKRKAA